MVDLVEKVLHKVSDNELIFVVHAGEEAISMRAVRGGQETLDMLEFEGWGYLIVVGVVNNGC